MNTGCPRILVLCLCLAAGVASAGPAGGAPAGEQAGPRVLSAGPSAVVLELSRPAVRLGRQQAGGETFDVVAVDGWGATTRPGWPQLPVHGVLLAAPAGGRPELRILQAGYEVWSNVRPLPAPRLVAQEIGGSMEARPEHRADPQAYAAGALYPAEPVEIGFVAKIRDQYVVQVLFQPVQVDAARREARVFHNLRVEVRFGRGPASVRPADATPFDRLLAHTLANYDSLRGREAVERVAAEPTGAPSTAPLQPPPALKVVVDADGIFRLTGRALAEAGLDLAGVDPRRLQLTHQTVPVPVRMIGTEDGRLDADDAVEFYGVAMSGQYTNRNVYWLSLIEGPGLRLVDRDGTPRPDLPVAGTFTRTLHLEENRVYWQDLSTGEGLPDGEGKDHWFWDRIVAGETHTYTFPVAEPAETGGQAAVRVSLRGRTDVPQVAPDHHTRVYLNDQLLDDAGWDGKIEYQVVVTIPQAALRPGTNTLVVQSVGDTGASVDSIFLDWFEIDYARRYVAEEDVLTFAAPGPGEFSFDVDGFGQAEVEVYDIADPYSPVRISHATRQTGTGRFAVQFADQASSQSRYFAVTGQGVRTPAALTLDEPSSLRLPGNRADYILITHRSLLDAAQRLAAHRRDAGLDVAVVDVDDIYDEFSGGIFDPRAIRDFLVYAYHNWARPAPTYVLLLGDATYDYRNYLGTGRINYVPASLVETPGFGAAPSDTWYAEVSGEDILPDLFVGRLSAATPQDAATMVDKIINYEALPAPTGWNRSAVFVTDDQAEFEMSADELVAFLPASVEPLRIYTRLYSQPQNPTTDLISAVDRGTLVVSYIGHGNVGLWGSWAGGRIFETSTIDQLNNGPRLPLMTVIGCLNGFFVHPEIGNSLAEEWVRAPGRGGVAAWAPSALGYLGPETGLLGEFYDALFAGSDVPLGAATTEATTLALGSGAITPDLARTYVLLGDPALHLDVPGPLYRVVLPEIRRGSEN